MAPAELGDSGFGLFCSPSVLQMPYHAFVPCDRRNTSVDENYEWDSEFPGDMELLETLHLGAAGPRPRPEAEPELGV